MNERGQKAKHTVERHLAALRLTRFRQIVRTIPLRALLSPRQWLAYRAYAAMVCEHLGKKGLARVVWPWLYASAPTPPPYQVGRWRRERRIADPNRVKRGRLSNPTVLR